MNALPHGALALSSLEEQMLQPGVKGLPLTAPLRQGAIDSATPAFGLLVLGSQDPQRFDATMGTDFLSRMAEIASAALLRLK